MNAVETNEVEQTDAEKRVRRMAAVIISSNLSENEEQLAEYLRVNITRIVQADHATPSPLTPEEAKERAPSYIVNCQKCGAVVELFPSIPPSSAEIANAITNAAQAIVDIAVKDRMQCPHRGTIEMIIRDKVVNTLVATPTETGWQPIESAPKDGTPVIISVASFVGEAAYRVEGSHEGAWWWANEGPGD